MAKAARDGITPTGRPNGTRPRCRNGREASREGQFPVHACCRPTRGPARGRTALARRKVLQEMLMGGGDALGLGRTVSMSKRFRLFQAALGLAAAVFFVM